MNLRSVLTPAILLFATFNQLVAGDNHSWMCTIFDARWKFVCYCAVLNNQWVITSAECFKRCMKIL
jgi:hypothetical protein